MPTLELAYSEAETIALEAAALGRLTPEQAQVLRTFFADLEKNALSVLPSWADGGFTQL
jgi:hypothetical protein